jgi:hypothetical protein
MMNDIKNLMAIYKASAGCRRCGYNKNTRALHFAHRDPNTKYRDKNGRVVEPSDMIKGRDRSRYGIETIIAEIAKCDVLCANCHTEETFEYPVR